MQVPNQRWLVAKFQFQFNSTGSTCTTRTTIVCTGATGTLAASEKYHATSTTLATVRRLLGRFRDIARTVAAPTRHSPPSTFHFRFHFILFSVTELLTSRSLFGWIRTIFPGGMLVMFCVCFGSVLAEVALRQRIMHAWPGSVHNIICRRHFRFIVTHAYSHLW